LEYKRDLASPKRVLRTLVAFATAVLDADYAQPGAPIRVAVFDDRVVSYLRAEGGRSTAEIAVLIGLSARSVQHRLASLAERGLVVAVGSGPRDPRRRCFATR